MLRGKTDEEMILQAKQERIRFAIDHLKVRGE